MAAKIAELRQEGVKCADRIQVLAKEYNERKTAGKEATELWPEAAKTEWDEVNQRYEAIKSEIKDLEHEADVVARAAEAGEWLERSRTEPDRRPDSDQLLPGSDDQTYGDLGTNRDGNRAVEQRYRDMSLGFQIWASRGVPDVPVTDEHKEACSRLKFDPTCTELQLRHIDTRPYTAFQRQMARTHPDCRDGLLATLLEQRALSSGLGSAGGFLTIPATYVRAFELASIQFGAMLEVADTMTTATGEEMGWPVGDDTANEARYTDESVDEGAAVNDPKFEAVKWRSHDLTSGFIKVPYRLFRDSFLDLESIIGVMMGERFGRKVSGEATNGTSKISGIIPRSPVGHTAAAASAVEYGDLMGVEHAVDPSLRGGLRYMMHDAILELFRLLTDSQSRPLWTTNIRDAQPDTLNGRRYVINQKMSSTTATGDKSVVAGDFRFYKIRRVGPSLRSKRLVERFADTDEIGFISYSSQDGNLLRPQADLACPIQVLDHP